jgi:hypothetical protein
MPLEIFTGLKGFRIEEYRKELILAFIYNLYLYISKKLTITEELKSTRCDIPWPPQTGHLHQIIQEGMCRDNP